MNFDKVRTGHPDTGELIELFQPRWWQFWRWIWWFFTRAPKRRSVFCVKDAAGKIRLIQSRATAFKMVSRQNHRQETAAQTKL